MLWLHLYWRLLTVTLDVLVYMHITENQQHRLFNPSAICVHGSTCKFYLIWNWMLFVILTWYCHETFRVIFCNGHFSKIISSSTVFSKRSRSLLWPLTSMNTSLCTFSYFHSSKLGSSLSLINFNFHEQTVSELHSNRANTTSSDRNYATMPVFSTSGAMKSPRY